MANVGINADDQRRIREFKDEFDKRYGGRSCTDCKAKVQLFADMLKWSYEYLYRIGLDGYVKIETSTRQKTVAGLVIPGAEEEVYSPVVTVTGRIDKRQQAYLDEGVDIERKVYDAQRHSSKQMREQGWDTDLMQ